MRTHLCCVACLLLVLVLSACGGDSTSGQMLVAPPTRTPAPTGEPAQARPAGAPVETAIISLRDEVSTYLADFDIASYTDVIQRDLIGPAGDCMDLSYWPGLDPLQLFARSRSRLPIGWWGFNPIDRWVMANWPGRVDLFPEAALIEAADDALSAATETWPTGGAFTVCLLPRPGFADDLTQEPTLGLVSIVPNPDVLLVGCSAGEVCLQGLAAQVAFGYSYARQMGALADNGLDIPLAAHILMHGRSAVFVETLYPDQPLFDGDYLSVAQQAALWTDMQGDGEGRNYLMWPYRDDYRADNRMDGFLYGDQQDNDPPAYGGVYIGYRVVKAYLAAHPDTSITDLMALPLDTLYDESGYEAVLAAAATGDSGS